MGVSTGIRAARARSLVYLPKVADLDCEFAFLSGLGTGVSVTLVLVVILRYLCPSRVEPAAHRVRHVRLNNSEYDRTERFNVVQSKISDRRIVTL